MIALDTSAIVSLAISEADAEPIAARMAGQESLVGAPTIFELAMVLSDKMIDGGEGFMRDFIARRRLTVVAFDVALMTVARAAFANFGRGRGGKAKLNFGDCMSYAVAKHHHVPLLFKGGDFLHTDIAPAYLPAA
jgi:ribonuclease VapC